MVSTPSVLSVLSRAEVIARLSESATGDAFVAFDADGTLWSGDIGVDTFEAALAGKVLRDEACARLREEAARFDLPARADASETAAELFRAFERGAYPEDRAFSMMAWAFAGYLLDDARAFAAGVIEKVGLQGRLHDEILPVVSWLAERRVPMYVVSASPAWVIETAVRILDLPFSGVFAMTPAQVGDRIAPSIREPITYGAGKTAALRQSLPGRPLAGAFGDSAFDLPMLAEAKVAVAVRPKPGLVAEAEKCPGLIELERTA